MTLRFIRTGWTHRGKNSSLVHESFHSISAGLNEPDFQLYRGFEEGVVEACTRLFRDVILAPIGLPPATDVRTSYNRYLTALETLRSRTGQSRNRFLSFAAVNAIVNPRSNCVTMDTGRRTCEELLAD